MIFSTEEHWRFYAEFCRGELALGGPSTQLATVVAMCEGLSEEEKLWRTFCYAATYNVPYGEVIWLNNSKKIDKKWLRAAFNSKHMVTRFERRCLRRADWMEEYFGGVYTFIDDFPKLQKQCQEVSPEVAYELAWDRLNAMPRVGRYIAFRLVELLSRQDLLVVRTPDIRPRGARTPRAQLAVLYPNRGLAEGGEDPVGIALLSRTAADALDNLHVSGIPFNFYQLQVTLCEYRQSWRSGKQYPGRGLDSELAYACRAEGDWGYRSAIWEVRAKMFPHRHLGEIGGWDGPRKATARTLIDHGYTWSDLTYDYSNTKDFSAPVRWVQ